MKYKQEFAGEMIGTFLLVLFGCGSVAVSVLFDAHQGLFQIGILWGIGVSLAIYVTRHLSCAHLNPAVTLAMVTSRRMAAKKMPAYLSGQFIGAFLAGVAVYLIFRTPIAGYEIANAILRGSPESVQTARMFGEFYVPLGSTPIISMVLAMAVEAFGTFLLVLLIFSLTEGCNLGRPHDNSAPILIGLSVTSIICLLAPLTQAGLNPARDLGPRLAAWIFGWSGAAFPDRSGGFIFVYLLGPIIGGQAGGLLFTKILEPLMNAPKETCSCNDDIIIGGGAK
ncbi:MAG: MIP/aquaporin family protein [Clostridiales bacterium]